MKKQSKPISEQVVVVTGASSGIGLGTAKLAAKKGAKVVLNARHEEALKEIVSEIRQAGGEAIYVAGDVADPQTSDQIASHALETFGRIDTWVNNAGVSTFGYLTEVPLEEQRRIFEVNFWGLIYGSLKAVSVMKSPGGRIINMGSASSERSIAVQGIYSSSKHAVKAFTDALRLELEDLRLPVSVTLILPGPIHTPFLDHAENHLDREPSFPPPVYSTDVAAKATVECMESYHRHVFVGGGGKALSILETLSPRLADFYAHLFLFSGQRAEEPADPRRKPNVFEPPPHEGDVHGSSYKGHVSKSSLYTEMVMNPGKTAMIAAGVIAGATAAYAYFRGNDELT
jgi:short-subunit dehydrogenase